MNGYSETRRGIAREAAVRNSIELSQSLEALEEEAVREEVLALHVRFARNGRPAGNALDRTDRCSGIMEGRERAKITGTTDTSS